MDWGTGWFWGHWSMDPHLQMNSWKRMEAYEWRAWERNESEGGEIFCWVIREKLQRLERERYAPNSALNTNPSPNPEGLELGSVPSWFRKLERESRELRNSREQERHSRVWSVSCGERASRLLLLLKPRGKQPTFNREFKGGRNHEPIRALSCVLTCPYEIV